MREERESERRRSVDPREWVETYGDVLYRFARARLPDVETAEDVVQETFLAALEAHDTFAGESTEQTWLIGILRRKIVDHYRQSARKRGGKRADEAAPEFDARGKWVSDPHKWQFDPAAIAENREFWQIFEDCRSKLPKKLAEAYRLREDAELTTEEICQVLGISASNLWTQLYRARLLLRKCIEGKWFQPPQ